MPYLEGVHYRIEDDHWIWIRYCLPSKTRKKLRYDDYSGEDSDRRGPYAKTITDDGDYPLHYVYERSPEPRARLKGSLIHPKRPLMAESLDIPLSELPEVRRTCSNPLCVNPKHHTLIQPKAKGPITLQELIDAGISPYLSPPAIEAEFNNRPLPLEVYQALSALEDDD